jgi:hypothetical protein
MSWLTKIFEAIQKGLQIFEGIQPVVQSVLPSGTSGTLAQVTDDFTRIAQAITNAQAVIAAVSTPGATPASIITAAGPLVANVIAESEVVLQSKVTNEAQYATAINTITQGVVELLGALGKK